MVWMRQLQTGSRITSGREVQASPAEEIHLGCKRENSRFSFPTTHLHFSPTCCRAGWLAGQPTDWAGLVKLQQKTGVYLGVLSPSRQNLHDGV